MHIQAAVSLLGDSLSRRHGNRVGAQGLWMAMHGNACGHGDGPIDGEHRWRHLRDGCHAGTHDAWRGACACSAALERHLLDAEEMGFGQTADSHQVAPDQCAEDACLRQSMTQSSARCAHHTLSSNHLQVLALQGLLRW